MKTSTCMSSHSLIWTHVCENKNNSCIRRIQLETHAQTHSLVTSVRLINSENKLNPRTIVKTSHPRINRSHRDAPTAACTAACTADPETLNTASCVPRCSTGQHPPGRSLPIDQSKTTTADRKQSSGSARSYAPKFHPAGSRSVGIQRQRRPFPGEDVPGSVYRMQCWNANRCSLLPFNGRLRLLTCTLFE